MTREHGGGAPGAAGARGGVGSWIDPGVLLVVAGCAVISAAMVVPAQDGLREAENERDIARAVESWQAERLERYAARIDAVRYPDETAVRGLAARELNLMPTGTRLAAVGEGGVACSGSFDVFAEIEPAFAMPAVRSGTDSLLGRMVRERRTRVLLLGMGTVLVLFGLAGVAGPRRGCARERGSGASSVGGYTR